MNEEEPSKKLFTSALVGMYAMGLLNLPSLNTMAAPYGKHLRSGWGPAIPAPLAWFVMESPSLWVTLIILFRNRNNHLPPVEFLGLSLFLLHYTHRTLVYPLRLLINSRERGGGGGGGQGVPLPIASLAFFFNVYNAYLQTTSLLLTTHHHSSTSTVVIWIRIALGLCVFFWGMAVNISSDIRLLRIKKESGGAYVIPKGGWFDLVCSPNYMGEVIEWLGWSIVLWSPASLSFFLYTCSVLVPRARANLLWYREKFKEDYPTSTKAILPFLY